MLPTDTFEGISFTGRKVALFPNSRHQQLTASNRRAYVCLAIKQRLNEMNLVTSGFFIITGPINNLYLSQVSTDLNILLCHCVLILFLRPIFLAW